MKRLLLIHTAGAQGTIALADESGVVAEAVLPGRTSSERLVPEVRRLLAAAGWALAELSAVGVVHGPGSFTGVRVGLSAAKGLSEAAGVALIAVSRLTLLARACGATGLVCAMLDAGRGELYFGAYEDGVCLRESLMTAAEVIDAIGSGRAVACEAKVVDALGGVDVLMLDEPVAGDLLQIVLERLDRGAVDDAAVVDANYLRRTDYEIQAKLTRRAAGLEV